MAETPTTPKPRGRPKADKKEPEEEKEEVEEEAAKEEEMEVEAPVIAEKSSIPSDLPEDELKKLAGKTVKKGDEEYVIVVQVDTPPPLESLTLLTLTLILAL